MSHKKVITPLHFERPRAFTQKERDEILQQSTIPKQYPDYYISSLPELKPTKEYVISDQDYMQFQKITFNTSRAVNDDVYKDNQEIYDNLISLIHINKTGIISDSINVICNTKTNSEELKDFVEVKSSKDFIPNWGIQATKDIAKGDYIVQMSMDGVLSPDKYIQPSDYIHFSHKKHEAYIVKHIIKLINKYLDMVALSLPTELDPSIPPDLKVAAADAFCLGTHLVVRHFGQNQHFLGTFPSYDKSLKSLDKQSYHQSFHIPWAKIDNLYIPSTMNMDRSHLFTQLDNIQPRYPLYQDSEVMKFLKDAKLERKNYYQVLSFLVCQLFQSSGFTPEAIQGTVAWALATIATSSIKCPNLPLDEPNYSSTRLQLRELVPNTNWYLAPIIHLLNDCCYANCEVEDVFDNIYDDEQYPIKLRATRDIKAGEQLTLNYLNRDINHIDYNPITSENENDYITKLSTENDPTKLLQLSIFRVPEIVDAMKNKTLTLIDEPKYGFYSKLYAQQNIALQLPVNSCYIWFPNINYLTHDFKSSPFVKFPKSATKHKLGQPQPYKYIPESLKRHPVNYIHPCLGYNEAPIKYLFPGLVDDALRERLKKEVPDYYDLYIHVYHVLANGRNPLHCEDLIHKFSINYFGLGSLLYAALKVFSAAGVPAPSPSVAKAEIIASLPESERKKIKSPDNYKITQKQSYDYCFDKMKQRMQYVMTKFNESYRAHYKTKTNPTTQELLFFLISDEQYQYKIDDQQEYCALILTFLSIQELIERSTVDYNIESQFVAITTEHIPPTLNSSICNFRYATTIKETKGDPQFFGYDCSMTNLLYYNRLSLTSHVEQVFAQRLGLLEYIKYNTKGDKLNTQITL